MAELLLPFFAHIVMLAQQLEWQIDEVVKIHALISQQALFVMRHDDSRLHGIGIACGGL